MDEQYPPDEVRSARAVALRSVALITIIAVAFRADRLKMREWLSDNELIDELAPSEVAFIDTVEPTAKQVVNAGWLAERLIVLLWALRKLDALPPAKEQCDTSVFMTILPPYSDVAPSDFIAMAELRPEEELFAKSNEYLNLH